MKLQSLFLACSLLAAGAQAAEAPATYTNPVITQPSTADPHVILHKGVYYLYPTHSGKTYDVFTSTDLVHWKKKPPCYEDPAGGLWAPDVFHNKRGDGKFYLYYTGGPLEKKVVGVAISDSPLGPFEDKGVLFEKAIDAHMFQDTDGKYYLYYVSVDGCNRIYVQPMKDPLTKAEAKPALMIRADEPWECVAGEVAEGPWMIKRDGTYYMMYSGTGAMSPNYAVGYATAKSPTGPFAKYKGNPIAKRGPGVYGPGHHCVVTGPKGDLWMVYHQKINDDVAWGRFITLDPLWFDDKGVMHTRTTRGTEHPAP